MQQSPRLIQFPKIGSPDIGFISVAELKADIPFEIKRVFWTYETPDSIVRGRHAHHQTEMVVIAVHGRIIVHTELPNTTLQTFVLESPEQGVYLPTNTWHSLQYSPGAVQLVVASTLYEETDYIRDYQTFRQIERPTSN